jgi:anti-sigma B factor antagonist
MHGQSIETWLTIEQSEDVTIGTFIVRAIMDERVIRIIGQELYRLVEQQGQDRLVLDFGDVKHFSSALLAVLIELNKKVNATKGRLALCGLSPELREVFVVTKLIDRLNIYKNRSEALDSFA